MGEGLGSLDLYHVGFSFCSRVVVRLAGLRLCLEAKQGSQAVRLPATATTDGEAGVFVGVSHAVSFAPR
jgi:hypothetical protein